MEEFDEESDEEDLCHILRMLEQFWRGSPWKVREDYLALAAYYRCSLLETCFRDVLGVLDRGQMSTR